MMLRFLLIFLLCTVNAYALPVFPGAEGFGTNTSGGRGGIVCQVTNLNDEGAGSLRACIEEAGPRLIIFRQGGTIRLHSPLIITNPYISIFGQTASGSGIMLTGNDVLSDELLTITTHDVVIQHLRLRQSLTDKPACCHNVIGIKGVEGESDGSQVHDIVLDHCSVSGATGNAIALEYDTNTLTISNSILGPGIVTASKEASIEGKGITIDGEGSHSISLHHNLIVDSQEQNPGLQIAKGVADIVNNVVYNWVKKGAEIRSDNGEAQLNMVHNLYIMGPDSTPDTPEIIASHTGKNYQLFLEENLSIRDAEQPEPLPVNLGLEGWPDNSWEASSRFESPLVDTVKSNTVRKKLLAMVGANLPKRDFIDKNLVQQVKHYQDRLAYCSSLNPKGDKLQCDQYVSQLPDYTAGKPLADKDNDGMPDEWEKKNNLNPEQDDALQDSNINGYSNIEEWIFSLTPPPLEPTL